METQRLYYEYTSAEPFRAEILTTLPYRTALQSNALAILLDRTIFYPEGGGQSGDRGTINGIPLVDVIEQDGEILHILDLPQEAVDSWPTLMAGPAELLLDAPRRRDLTVHHTAQHLLSGVLLRLFGANTVSMHLGDGICTIDVDIPALSPEEILAAEEAVQDAVEEDAPIYIHLCPPERLQDFPLRKSPPLSEEVIRVVEIQGQDFSACCGTHLDSTAKIGALRILGAEKHRGMTRLSFLAGRRLLWHSRMLAQNGDTISHALSVPMAEIGQGVLDLQERMGHLEKRLKDLEEVDAMHQAEALIRRGSLPALGVETESGCPVYRELFPDATMEDLLRVGRAAQKRTSAVLVLGSLRELKFAALSSRPGIDLRPFCAAPMKAQGGRGGGGASFFQGQFDSQNGLTEFFNRLPERI